MAWKLLGVWIVVAFFCGILIAVERWDRRHKDSRGWLLIWAGAVEGVLLGVAMGGGWLVVEIVRRL